MRTYTNKLGLWITNRDGGGQVMYRAEVGDIVDIAPHCDLFMQGAKTAEIRRIYCDGPCTIRVRPIVAGVPQTSLRTIQAHHILSPRKA